MYKDPLKQREACRLSMQRLRAKRKGVTVIPSVILEDVIPLRDIPVIPSRELRPPLTKSEQVKGRFKEVN